VVDYIIGLIMSWARIDDEAWYHEKFEELRSHGVEGMAAIGLWAMAVSFTGQKQSPKLSLAEATMLCGGDQNLASRCFDLLRFASLADDPSASMCLPFASQAEQRSIVIHDWEKYRSKNEARAFAGRLGGRKSGEIRRAKAEAEAQAECEAKVEANRSKPQAPSPIPSPIPSPNQKNKTLSQADSLPDKFSSQILDVRDGLLNNNADIDEMSRDVTGQARNSGHVTQTDRPTDRPTRPTDRPQLDTVSENRRSEILDVFAHYRTRHPKATRKPNSGMKTWKLIRDRLVRDGRSVDELKRAIDGMHVDPWEGRAQHLDLKYAVRDDEAVTRFIEMAENPQKPKKIPPSTGPVHMTPEMWAIADAQTEALRKKRESEND